MKVLGLHCGRKMGNNEVLLKEALMEAKNMGAEVSMIRLLDLNIQPCKGCIACNMDLNKGGAGKCVLKDDFHFLDEQLMDCDALILAAPVFVLGPNGIIKVIADRLGPSHDVVWRRNAKNIREKLIEEGTKVPKQGPDERAFKKRVGAFIATGGAVTPNWLVFGLPLMNLFTFSCGIKIIDQMEVMGIGQFFNVVLKPEEIERAKKLGRNIVESMQKPFEEVTWRGDEEGTCPVCHCKLLWVSKKNPVECPVCGIRGTLTMEGDEIKVTFSEEEQRRSRLTLGGLDEHVTEIADNLKIAMNRPDISEIPQRLEKYKSETYESFVLEKSE